MEPQHKSNPQQGSQVTVSQTTQIYQGLLPPPQALQQYEQIVPGFAQQLMDMAREEQDHRHKIEFIAIEADKEHNRSLQRTQRRGQLFGLLIGLAVTALCVYAIYSGFANEAAKIAIAVITSSILAFVATQVLKRKKDN